MSTDYDVTTERPGYADAASRQAPAAVEPDDAPGVSALELLREVVEHREEGEPWVRVLPGGDVRVTCHTDVPYTQFQRWQRAAMGMNGKGGRRARGGQVDVTRIDQFLMATSALLHCGEMIEVRNRRVKDAAADGAWITVTDPHSGARLSFDDQAVLTMFRTPDPRSLLVKLWGRESDVISAGMDLLDACGHLGADDEPDPT
jgi:hypothetical protein